MREWINLFEYSQDIIPVWIDTRGKRIIRFEGHHNLYLLDHFLDFGLKQSDVAPYLHLDRENEDDYLDLINRRDLREPALARGWCRAMISQEHGNWSIQMEAQNMRKLYRGCMVLMDDGMVLNRNTSFIYDLTDTDRGGNLSGERFVDFIETGRF